MLRPAVRTREAGRGGALALPRRADGAAGVAGAPPESVIVVLVVGAAARAAVVVVVVGATVVVVDAARAAVVDTGGGGRRDAAAGAAELEVVPEPGLSRDRGVVGAREPGGDRGGLLDRDLDDLVHGDDDGVEVVAGVDSSATVVASSLPTGSCEAELRMPRLAATAALPAVSTMAADPAKVRARRRFMSVTVRRAPPEAGHRTVKCGQSPPTGPVRAWEPVAVELLLVEDDDAIAEPLVKGLERQGFAVTP